MLDVKKCVKNCIIKYGLSQEDATRIATTDNILLSIEDLRYKYDDMQIGTSYPDWITPEEHLKMCYATVCKKYYGDDTLTKDFYSIEDVAMDLFVHSAIHIHSYKDKYQLNGLLLCKMRNLLRDKTREVSCYYETYDWEDENITKLNSLDTGSKYNKAVKYGSVSKETADVATLVMTVESIKNNRVKGILLICGYFLADIQEFLQPLVAYYNTSTDLIKNKIYDLGRDDRFFCEAVNRKVDTTDKVNVTVGRVLKIFGKRDKSYLQTDLLPYLENIGLNI